MSKKVDIIDISGKGTVEPVELSDFWTCDYTKTLVHQVVTAELAAKRQGTKAQLNRGSITKSNRKPHAQKGSGRARAGDKKGPIWRSGGVTFAQRNVRSYTQKVNKKMRVKAKRMVLANLMANNKITVVTDDTFAADSGQIKTRSLLETLTKLNQNNSKLMIITKSKQDSLIKSSGNLHYVQVNSQEVGYPTHELIKARNIILTKSALDSIQKREVEEVS
jgi:large subunit ribosomal protein L4